MIAAPRALWCPLVALSTRAQEKRRRQDVVLLLLLLVLHQLAHVHTKTDSARQRHPSMHTNLQKQFFLVSSLSCGHLQLNQQKSWFASRAPSSRSQRYHPRGIRKCASRRRTRTHAQTTLSNGGDELAWPVDTEMPRRYRLEFRFQQLQQPQHSEGTLGEGTTEKGVDESCLPAWALYRFRIIARGLSSIIILSRICYFPETSSHCHNYTFHYLLTSF